MSPGGCDKVCFSLRPSLPLIAHYLLSRYSTSVGKSPSIFYIRVARVDEAARRNRKHLQINNKRYTRILVRIYVGNQLATMRSLRRERESVNNADL